MIFLGLSFWDVFVAALTSGLRKLLNIKSLIAISIVSGVSLIVFGKYFGDTKGFMHTGVRLHLVFFDVPIDIHFVKFLSLHSYSKHIRMSYEQYYIGGEYVYFY
jgi:hypothetical protein